MAFGSMEKAGVQLRATITNPGSYTRSQMLDRLYAELFPVLYNDPTKIIDVKVVFCWDVFDGTDYKEIGVYESCLFRRDGYIGLGACHNVKGTKYVNELNIKSSGSQFFYKYDNNNWAEASSAADMKEIRLYY